MIVPSDKIQVRQDEGGVWIAQSRFLPGGHAHGAESMNCGQLDRRLRPTECALVRATGSHRHYSNPFRRDRLITFAWHAGDVPRGLIADSIKDLGIPRDEFYFQRD